MSTVPLTLDRPAEPAPTATHARRHGKPLVTERLTGWHIVGSMFAAAVGVAVTWNAWEEIYTFAKRDEEASHIFLVIPVALYMVWVRRMRWRHCRPSGTIIGPMMVLAGWALSHYGFNYQ